MLSLLKSSTNSIIKRFYLRKKGRNSDQVTDEGTAKIKINEGGRSLKL